MTDQKWADACLGKYFRLSAETSGLISSAAGAQDRVNSLIRSRRDAEERLGVLNEFIGTTSGENKNVFRERDEVERELKRIEAALPLAIAARAALTKQILAAGSVSHSCGALLVRLGLLNANEVV